MSEKHEWTEEEQIRIDTVVEGMHGTIQKNEPNDGISTAALLILTAFYCVNATDNSDDAIIEEFRKCLVSQRIGAAEGGIQ